MQLGDIKQKNKIAYGILVLFELIMFIINNAFGINVLNAIPNIIMSICIIFYITKNTKSLISPLNIFCFIWLFLISITSFSYPVMREMNTSEWNFCYGFIISFSIGGFLSCFLKTRKKGNEGQEKGYRITYFQYWLFISLIFIGILVHIYQVVQYGGLVILSDHPSNERNVYTISGLGTLSTLGSLGIFGIFGDYRYRKKTLYLIASILYLFLLFAEGVRFQLFFTVIICASLFSYKIVRKKQIVSLLILGVLAIVTFIFISNVRKTDDNIYNWYVKTGLYSGDIKYFSATEIFRYFGYGQRLFSYYVEKYGPGSYPLAYTLYPISHTLGINDTRPVCFWENGYNAVSLIRNLYIDFGYLWPLAAIAYSILINSSFNKYLVNRCNLVSTYFWALSCFSLVMSFYCYIDSYVFAVLYYPILIGIISLFGNSKKATYSPRNFEGNCL